MKVTVCFGKVRVVVPCGNGEILVQSLIEKAIHRYKKATGKPAGSYVTVHNLKSLSDGGILDPDDRLNDVADDREQIIALYEESHGTTVLPLSDNGGGTSASSIGTESPEMFQSEDCKSDASTGQTECHTDVEIIGDCVPLGISTLQVRRGSEPALNRLSPAPNIYADPMKRWSTAVALGDKNQRCSELDNEKIEEKSDAEIYSDREDGSSEEKSAFIPFSREAGRISILGNNLEMNRWADAADRQVYKLFDSRKEPLGASIHRTSNYDKSHLIVLKNDGRPLGIHVVPECEENGRVPGLLVQGIEAGGQIERDGRIKINDKITEINGHSLANISFHRAQDIFKEAMLEREISVRLSKLHGYYGPPAPVYPHRALESSKSDADFEYDRVDGNERGMNIANTYPPAGHRSANAVMNSNTRRIGKKYHIKLTKGPNGLGFSITTRDNVTGGSSPFYIKKIMPVGAAIEDGRLKPGDRLLEVNGVELTGKSQDEAVATLRNSPTGSEIHLTVSRQEQVEGSPTLPRAIISTDSNIHRSEFPFLLPAASPLRDIPPDKVIEDSTQFLWKQRECFTFDIPLNDTGSAGLGVSVKGKTSTGPNGTSDLGIFVKSVIRGGAAYKDGRLRENDQLTNINGVSLLRMPNSQAMETLRRVMHQEGPRPGAITLTVARRINVGSNNFASFSSTQTTNTDFSSSDKSQTPTSDASTSDSDRTAVYCPYRNKNVNEEDHNFNQGSVMKIEDKDLGLDYLPTKNPIVERITGQKMPRNDSFYQACHDSWNGSPVTKYVNGSTTASKPNYFGMSPTIVACQDESVLIENDYVSSSRSSSQKAKANRPVPRDNFLSDSKQSIESDGNKTIGESNVSCVSQISLDDGDGANFERAGFGRQSMSEKRNAQLDAKNTDTWQRNKRAREARDKSSPDEMDQSSPLTRKNVGASDVSQSNLVRCNSADSVISAVRAGNISSGYMKERRMKRSNSLESLPKEEEIYGRSNGAAGRGRVCNESFRAAVDRSYDAPGATDENMETLDEESESGSSNQIGRGQFSQGLQSGLELAQEPSAVLGGSGAGSFNKSKKKGFIKNLFKFGKNKKENTPAGHFKSALESEHYTKVDPEMIYIRKVPEDENKDKFQNEKKIGGRPEEEKYGQHGGINANNNNNMTNSQLQNSKSPGWPPREEIPLNHNPQLPPGHRYGQLRAQHQKRHQERQGIYPQDEKEEKLQQHVQKQVDRKFEPLPGPKDGLLAFEGSRRSCRGYFVDQHLQPETVHSRSHSYDLYQERIIPRSQSIVNSTSKYSHYVNYEEIQQHLLRQQNQTQTLPQQLSRPPPPPPVRRDRPVSNFYEYETVRANMNHHRQVNGPPPPRTMNENKGGHGGMANRPPIIHRPIQTSGYTNGHTSSLRSRRPAPIVQHQQHYNNYSKESIVMINSRSSHNNQTKTHQSASSLGKFMNNGYRGHPPPPPPQSNGNKYMQVMDGTAISGSKV